MLIGCGREGVRCKWSSDKGEGEKRVGRVHGGRAPARPELLGEPEPTL